MTRVNSKTILITRPKDDDTTNYLFYWTEQIIKQARDKGFKVLDLSGPKANRKMVESYLAKNLPGIIVFNGHGSAKVITGHNQEILIDVNSDNKNLREALIYARSCKSGQILGKVLAQNGAGAFIGYTKDFIFVCDLQFSTRPQKDQLAKLFLDPSNLIPISYIKGNSAHHSHDKSRKAMRKNIRYMLSSEASLEERSAAAYLWSNYSCQTLIQ